MWVGWGNAIATCSRLGVGAKAPKQLAPACGPQPLRGLESIIQPCNKVQEVTSIALSHAILATILGVPVSGYGLTKRFNRAIGYYWHATHQQIYRELATLEAYGYVERVPSPSPSTEKRYSLTQEGRDALAQWIAQPCEPGVLREDLLLQVRAGSLVPPEVLLAELRRRRAIHAERLAVYRALQEQDFPKPK